MSWQCPDDWKYKLKMVTAKESMLMHILFGDHQRFQPVRSIWFRRCNASGKWIWPMEKAYIGVVAIKEADIFSLTMNNTHGNYVMAWLSQKQYVLQKLKGNI